MPRIQRVGRDDVWTGEGDPEPRATIRRRDGEEVVVTQRRLERLLRVMRGGTQHPDDEAGG
jgi:hypothetical protein